MAGGGRGGDGGDGRDGRDGGGRAAMVELCNAAMVQCCGGVAGAEVMG